MFRVRRWILFRNKTQVHIPVKHCTRRNSQFFGLTSCETPFLHDGGVRTSLLLLNKTPLRAEWLKRFLKVDIVQTAYTFCRTIATGKNSVTLVFSPVEFKAALAKIEQEILKHWPNLWQQQLHRYFRDFCPRLRRDIQYCQFAILNMFNIPLSYLTSCPLSNNPQYTF